MMNRVLPDDLVRAYDDTGLIPIRLAWTTTDERGGCALDAMARWRGVTTQELRDSFSPRYEEGFLLAWDSDFPQSEEVVHKVRNEDDGILARGFCDGILCRSAVEKTFSATGITAVSNDS